MSSSKHPGYEQSDIPHGRVGLRMLQSFDPPSRPEPNPDLYTNYELSWLQFNWRVLHQATDINNPLLERVKFIGIVKSNLDEFFQKRVGGLKRQLDAGIESLSMDGMMPGEQLKAINAEVEQMIKRVRSVFFDILVPEMAEHGIEFTNYASLSDKHRAKMDEYFQHQLYPILTPLVVDHSHPFPFISNKSRSFAVELEDPVTGEFVFARVKIPANRPRWITVSKGKKGVKLLLIDELIRAKMDLLFPGAKVVSANVFRITRNADVARNEEEADDLLEMIEEELRERRFAAVVRLEVDKQMPQHVKSLLIDRMKVKKLDVFEMEGAIGLSDATELYKLKGFNELKFPVWVPVVHPALRLEESATGVMDAISRGDILVHHPYHSFATSVQRFIEEAANDPNVLAIKQTLYRTSKDSPLMHALMRAAEDGKQVAVLIELKARFDEERNIEWAQRLEQAGVHVAYGIAGLKIHSKMTVVVRQEGDTLKRYAHIGTGNYHPDTAQLYEDVGLFTCDEQITADVSDLFNFLTGFAPMQRYRKLLVAPKYMRSEITERIRYEAEEARAGRKGRIIMKMNNLEDPLVIGELYEASKAGVEIDCIVRSVCRLRPGIPGLSENIRIHSVIGRFLEHSRLYYFNHAGEEQVFLGSADMMHRNLDARVEAITPVECPPLRKYLYHVLDRYIHSSHQRWFLEQNGRYLEVENESSIYTSSRSEATDDHSNAIGTRHSEPYAIQQYLMKYTSQNQD
ncbi:MAG: polyphosphate kinase 1 [Bacteroidetes bacterium]|nr:polyphosphate kinase 1 [Bacteroidota bacterium]MCH8523673.1 polyphosphate kinase 1 [Balneolales bacterium]